MSHPLIIIISINLAKNWQLSLVLLCEIKHKIIIKIDYNVCNISWKSIENVN